jgi:hypothetical protein
MRVLGVGAILVAVLTFGHPVPVGAEPPSTEGAGLSDADVDRRLRFIEDRLDDSRLHGQIWYWSWMTVDVASAGGNAYAAHTFDGNHDDRVNASVNAAESVVGIVDLLARPLEARHGDDPVRGLPEATREEKLAKLRAAEDQLDRNAARAERRWSPADHAGNAALALAGGLTVGLWGNASDGVVTGVSSLVGGWLNLLTAPWQPEDDWKDYQSFIGRDTDRTSLNITVVALPGGAGAAIVYRW